MSMTLWPSKAELRRDATLQNAKEILSERLWSPIYETGGVDALIKERLIPGDQPPRSLLPNPGSPVK